MDDFEPVFTEFPTRENCMMKNAACSGKGCRKCGFYAGEDERRRDLPLVKLDNGLYGKRVGRRPED